MQPTRSNRMIMPEDPEELRALLMERMRERDRKHNNPHVAPSEDTARKEDRGTKEPRKTSTKQTRQKAKPYRLIYLTGEEVRAIKENSLTVEDIKTLNVDRDDDIPKVQTTIKAKTQGASATSCQTGDGPDKDNMDQTGPQQEPNADPSTGRAHERGPDETPAGAGEGRKTGRAHGEGQTGPRHEISADMRPGRVQATGPDETPAGAGEDRESGRAQGKDQTSARHEASTDRSSRRVHEKGPDRTPARVEKVGKTDVSRDGSTDQTSHRQRSDAGTCSRRDHETGPDETPAGAGENRESGRVQGEDQTSP